LGILVVELRSPADIGPQQPRKPQMQGQERRRPRDLSFRQGQAPESVPDPGQERNRRPWHA
jgi:hypothetical protein